MKLEVIAQDLSDIEMINKSEADRIEFCHDILIGGLTPTYGEIKQGCEISKLPVNVMVRPHNLGYVYSGMEFVQMLEDIKFINTTKAAGIVIGILTPDKKVDVERMKKVMETVKDKTVTFHRAFQEVEDQIQGLKDLHELGVKTVLTSGTAKINDSLDLLENLKKEKMVTILGGGGVDFTNVDEVKKVVDEVHVGLAVRDQRLWSQPISVEKIAEMKAKLK